AATNGVSFEEELALVTVHGLLHLLGWDHEIEEEAELMEAREGEYLAVVGRTRP
ncbi:MAG: rRNA maturation RNase YbeY, partial [Actinomycetota bacterium]|nr:rRNA maturation RNase YbeY [Actinomycetota bacterium]